MLVDNFNLDELETLAVSFGIRWDELRGETLQIKAASLVLWAERRESLYALLVAIIKQRPDIDWGERM